MRLYLILILHALSVLVQSTNLYQKQPTLQQATLQQTQAALLASTYQQQSTLQTQTQAEALLSSSSNAAAALSSQAATTAKAASAAAAQSASIASALTTTSGLSSYPFSLAGNSLADWNQFATGAWNLGSNTNFDLWASKQFNNAWVGDWLSQSPVQFQLPSWVDASSQSQWNTWAQILCAQQKMNAFNSLNSMNAMNSLNSINDLNALNSLNFLNGWTQGNGNGWLQQNSGLSNTFNGRQQSNWLNGNDNGYTYQTYNPQPEPYYQQPSGSGPWSGSYVGWTQPSGTGPWSGQYTGWTQNNGVWYNNGVGSYQDNSGNWYVNNNYNGYSNYDTNTNYNGYSNYNTNTNYNGYSNYNTNTNYNGVYVGPQPTGTGPWNGYFNGWTQNNGWWYDSNNNNDVGWYKDNTGNWYTNNGNNNNNWYSGSSNSNWYSNNGNGNGYYVGPSPSGSGPWNGQLSGWTQNNGWWYNNDNSGVGWYQDNSGSWYTNNGNGNGNGNGYYVGPSPSGSGPWNGQYSGWTQNNGWWYSNNNNGVGWYQDNSGNWYTNNGNGNANYGNGYNNWGFNGNTNYGTGVYVGPTPMGSGPWNGQYNGWTQGANGWWYDSNGNGWYQDNSGNWYTTSSTYSSSGLMGGFIGSGEGQLAGTVTSTQCTSTTVGQTNATLSCPSGNVIISVLAAAYGNTPGSCPSSVNTMTPVCTLNVTQLIQKSCRGQNQCSVTVQPNILGAPSNNGQQCLTGNNGPYSTTNQYTLVAQYTCGIAGPGLAGYNGALNSTSLTFTPPNSATSSSYLVSVILASLLAILLNMS